MAHDPPHRTCNEHVEREKKKQKFHLNSMVQERVEKKIHVIAIQSDD